MKTIFPWYDSDWLSSYTDAKAFLTRNEPEKLDEFIEVFEALKTPSDFEVVKIPHLFDPTVVEAIKEQVCNLPLQDLEKHELGEFGRLIYHNLEYFCELQNTLTTKVSELVGEPLEPTYNFLSMYNMAGICDIHLDTPRAKWTLDYCIDQSERWPIYVSQPIEWPEKWSNLGEEWQREIKADPDVKFSEIEIDPGDAILFSGSSQWHYRERKPKVTASSFCNLLFFHFTPLSYSNLCDPSKWADIFQVSELKNVVTTTNLENPYVIAD